MPSGATCGHCRFVVVLPDDWPSDGFTCPSCHQVTRLPRQIQLPPNQAPAPYYPAPAPAPYYPPPPPPPVFETSDAPVRIRHEHRARGTFGSMFGASMGCVFGVVCALGILAVLSFLACAGVIGIGNHAQELREKARQVEEKEMREKARQLEEKTRKTTKERVAQPAD